MDEIESIISGGSSMAEDQHQSAEQSSSSRREEPHPPQPEDGLKIRIVEELQRIQNNLGLFVIPHLDELKIKIDEELRRVGQKDDLGYWDRHCIYRTPKHLLVSRDTNNDAPYYFSLGPYQTQPRFQDVNQMNQHKLRGLKQMLERTGHDVKQYLDPMRELKEIALACYEGPLDLRHPDATTMNENDPFVEMMVLDGCFILEMLQGFSSSIGFKRLGYSEFDPVFKGGQFCCSIGLDIMRLENQIPLFVLSRLLGIQLGKFDCENDKVTEYAFNLFKFLSLSPKKSLVAPSRSVVIGLHLLDVLRSSIVKEDSQPANPPRKPEASSSTPPRKPDASSSTLPPLVHCVTDLLKAGVNFKKGDDKDKFWDVIKFKKGVLTIPKICIDRSTNTMLFNLIVYEQCHHKCSQYITYYAILLDQLINSAQDVSYLSRKGIIENCLGSDEEVANLFNRLSQGVALDSNNNYLAPVTKDLNVYYGRRRNTWLAILKSRYFDNPWTTISVVAAAVLLLLTAAQTFYTAYAYYKPV